MSFHFSVTIYHGKSGTRRWTMLCLGRQATAGKNTSQTLLQMKTKNAKPMPHARRSWIRQSPFPETWSGPTPTPTCAPFLLKQEVATSDLRWSIATCGTAMPLPPWIWMDAETELPSTVHYFFDAACFYAHNEYELGVWRAEWNKLGRQLVQQYRKN